MKPLILLTNDDGILSPGIKAAAEAVESLGEILIVAPRFQQTSLSRAFPKADSNGTIEQFKLNINDKNIIAYGVHGSPALAVSHAILEIAERKPDLCISGINYGENVGLSVISSGTIGAAFEADSYDIPAIAISSEVIINMHHSSNYDPVDWKGAIHFTSMLAQKALCNKFPRNVALLNVNIPSNASEKTPIRITKQSRQNYFIFEKPTKRDLAKSFKLGVRIEINEQTLESDSDIKALIFDKVVSITPMNWDLTVNIPSDFINVLNS